MKTLKKIKKRINTVSKVIFALLKKLVTAYKIVLTQTPGQQRL